MIDLTKQYQTRDGRKVELWKVVGQCVVGIIIYNEPYATQWERESGRYWYGGSGLSPADLVPVRQKFRIDRWVNVYPTFGNTAYYTTSHSRREDADGPQQEGSYHLRVACIPITIEGYEGDGLDTLLTKP